MSNEKRRAKADENRRVKAVTDAAIIDRVQFKMWMDDEANRFNYRNLGKEFFKSTNAIWVRAREVVLTPSLPNDPNLISPEMVDYVHKHFPEDV